MPTKVCELLLEFWQADTFLGEAQEEEHSVIEQMPGTCHRPHMSSHVFTDVNQRISDDRSFAPGRSLESLAAHRCGQAFMPCQPNNQSELRVLELTRSSSFCLSIRVAIGAVLSISSSMCWQLPCAWIMKQYSVRVM